MLSSYACVGTTPRIVSRANLHEGFLLATLVVLEYQCMVYELLYCRKLNKKLCTMHRVCTTRVQPVSVL